MINFIKKYIGLYMYAVSFFMSVTILGFHISNTLEYGFNEDNILLGLLMFVLCGLVGGFFVLGLMDSFKLLFNRWTHHFPIKIRITQTETVQND